MRSSLFLVLRFLHQDRAVVEVDIRHSSRRVSDMVRRPIVDTESYLTVSPVLGSIFILTFAPSFRTYSIL